MGEPELDDVVVVDVMRKAHEFGLTRAYSICLRYCTTHVQASNAVAWLIRAQVCQLSDLRAMALNYVRRRFRQIREEAQETLGELRAYPDLMLEVMVAIAI